MSSCRRHSRNVGFEHHFVEHRFTEHLFSIYNGLASIREKKTVAVLSRLRRCSSALRWCSGLKGRCSFAVGVISLSTSSCRRRFPKRRIRAPPSKVSTVSLSTALLSTWVRYTPALPQFKRQRPWQCSAACGGAQAPCAGAQA
jgi:hypothetical protein